MSMDYIKDLDGWNIIKKRLEKRINIPTFKVGEVWWTSVGVNIGVEIDGKGDRFTRPILIVAKFNNIHLLGIPLSSKIKDNKYYTVVNLKGRNVSAIVSQMKSLSAKRLLVLIGRIDTNELQIINESIKNLPSRSK